MSGPDLIGSTVAPASIPAGYAHHIGKWAFQVPFVCGPIDLGEALRRITEGR
ncbi:hypothetical protein NQU54_19940 [Streptomyces samsunensis]|uniref:PdxS/SNZ N-terminal domain-containing protein n=1 Tax=Streptomyces malaysiensis subsp. samsunensis TaxID=459658 RepID=A0A9X2LX73_STRMQ|nr:hypothetical protein [Streptomyces samsunensis]MCQ8831277.1 hypothetical protein [Streptomyces samsunensis]